MPFRPERLGPGAIYFRTLDDVFRSNADLIHVVEVEPQALWTKGTAAGAAPRGSPVELQALADLRQRKLTHGVGFPLGGTVCDQERHVDEFRRWTEGLSSPWTSEHLSVLDVQGAQDVRSCGFLMPPLQTEAAVALAAKNILHRAAVVRRPLAFETGVNYFTPQTFEMPDGEFFASVAETADCGILLDLANLWANHKNGRAKIDETLAKLPLERVWEVHLAGVTFAHGYWLDAHSGAIDDGLADVAATIIPDLPNLGAIIFEMAPDRLARFGKAAFLGQMERINRLWEFAHRAAPQPRRPRSFASQRAVRSGARPSSEAWERLLAFHMLPDRDRPTQADGQTEFEAPDGRAFALYAELATSFRRGAVADMLENCMRLLALAIGEPALRDLLGRYFAVAPPSTYPTDEALGFRRFLEADPPAVPGLADMLAFEASMIEAAADSRTVRISVTKDIDAMLGDIAAGRLPGPSSDRPLTTLEVGVLPAPFVRQVDRSLQTQIEIGPSNIA
jgi:uncharacterized protein